TRSKRDWSSDVCSSDLVMNDFYWSFFEKRTMIEKISKKILASPKLIIWMSMIVLIFCIASGFLLSNLLFYREPEETAAKEILSRSEERRVGKEWRVLGE